MHVCTDWITIPIQGAGDQPETHTEQQSLHAMHVPEVCSCTCSFRSAPFLGKWARGSKSCWKNYMLCICGLPIFVAMFW